MSQPEQLANIILNHLVRNSGLYIFAVHSTTEDKACTCRKGIKCSQIGKHPYLNTSWLKAATSDLDKFQKTIKGKNINYAIATGRRSPITGKYLIVVDVDTPEHEILRILPKTFSYKTGSSQGYHYWYWSPVPIRNSASKIFKKVDIRGSNGYVIIPPSKHKSGNSYEMLSAPNYPISDIPEDLLNLLTTKEEESVKTISSAKRKANKKLPEVTVDKAIIDWWYTASIQSLRNVIKTTEIPMGVRNHTIHRLLSSDRAKGVFAYGDLMKLANDYAKRLENPDSFSIRELHSITASVMRYPVYNTQFENVNKNYSKWLEKKGFSFDLKKIEEMDDKFFSLLVINAKTMVTLEQVTMLRNKWYEDNNIKGHAKYKSQLMAKKLISLGFTKTRTSKSNLWNVDLSGLARQEDMCHTVCKKEVQALDKRHNMTTEIETPVETTKDVTVGTGPIGPDGFPMTLVEEREEIIQTDRKYNPDDGKYQGGRQNQELMMANIKLFEMLSPEQELDYSNGVLLYDEERTRDFMGMLESGDLVGLKTEMYKVVSVGENELSLIARKYDKYARKFIFEGEEEVLSIYELDNALSLGFGQILYRNDKPFGLDKEMAYKVRVKVYADSVGRTYIFKTGQEIIPITEDTKEKADATQENK